MAYIIIAVVLMLVLAPIVSVLPSARQRAQMKMRDAARQAGVSVDITFIDDPNPKQGKYVSGVTGKALPAKLEVACYRLPRPLSTRDQATKNGTAGSEALSERKVHWRFERKSAGSAQGASAATETATETMGKGADAEQASALAPTEFPKADLSTELTAFLERELPRLPDDVQRVEEVASLISVYWHERQPGTEQQVISFLKQCATLPLHPPDASHRQGTN